MKRSIILLASCIGLALSVAAQQIGNDSPASKEDVERYFEVAHSSDMMKQRLQTMSKAIHEMAHNEYAKDHDKLPPDFEARTDQMLDDMVNNFSWDELLQAMVPAYQKHLTHGDMESLIAFYSTPVGQKILREMPAISADAMQSVMPIMQRQMEAMRQRVQQEVAQAMKPSQK